MRLLLSFCLLIFTGYANGQKSTLEEHRTGVYQYSEPPGYSHYYVKRTKKRHVEYTADKQHKLVFKVRWISDSEYWLEFVNFKNEDPGCLKIGDIIKVTITRSDEDGYTCSSTSKNCGEVTNVSFVKIE